MRAFKCSGCGRVLEFNEHARVPKEVRCSNCLGPMREEGAPARGPLAERPESKN